MSEELVKLERLIKDVYEMRIELQEVRDRVLTTPVCTAPNMCLKLESLLSDHEDRMRRLELNNARIIGAAVILNIGVVVVLKFL